MAYDELLADRIRGLLLADKVISSGGLLTEKKMFGGLGFMVGGNMAVAASGEGGILVRVDPAASDELVATTDARPMVMRGKPMAGWLRVDLDAGADDAELSRWVRTGAAYAGSLPAK